MSAKDDFNELSSTIKMMNDQLSMLNTLIDTSITSVHNLDEKIRSGLTNLHFEKIPNMTDEEVEKFLIDNAEPYLVAIQTESPNPDPNYPKYEPSRENITNLQENQKNVEEWKDKPFYDYARHVLKSIKDSIMEYQKLENERDTLMKTMHEIEDDYFSYVNTKEYKDKKKDQLQKLKDSIDEETDPLKRTKILRDIEYMENAESLEFLLDYTNEKGKNAIDNIADVYFNTQRSSLVMKKFAVRLPKLGYNKDIYKFFFNLEENFLPEEYHVFNNLFLFHVMRTISFMDVDSKRDNLYASAILVKMYNLVYHKFGDQELENEFIEFIRKFDDLFMDKWRDKFEKDNVTHPKHPARMEKEEEAKLRKRLLTIAELQNHGLDPDTSKSTEELVQLLKDTVAEKDAIKKAELEEWEAKNSPTPIETSGCVTEEDGVIEGTVEEMDGEPGEAIQMPSEGDQLPPVVRRGSTAGFIDTVVYLDKHGYYYRQVDDGSYTYFTDNNEVYETGFDEDTILKLLNTGSLEKVIRTFNLH